MSDPKKPPGPCILAFGPGTWNWPEVSGSPRYHLWTLAKMGWRVLYVEPPKEFHLFTRLWKAPDREFHVLTPGRVLPFGVRGIKSETSGERWRAFTSSQLVARAVSACDNLKMQPDVYWFGAPWHQTLRQRLPKTGICVTHVYDELSQSPILNQMQRELLWQWERELLRSCHIAFCSSLPQKERRAEVAKRSFLLENAVSADFLYKFAPYHMDEQTRRVAAQVEKYPSPRFIYSGVADLRVEPEYFRAIIENLPTGHILFFGRKESTLDPGFAAEMDANPRMHCLGHMPYHSLPGLLRMGDVLMVAHKRMPFTDAMYPEKLNEYLATGRPVVSVCLPEVGRVARESVHEGVIRTADSPWDFVAAATVAMNDKSEILEEKRVDIAREHTWEAMGERLDRELRMELDRVFHGRKEVTALTAVRTSTGVR
ncbi:hypothetical protein HZA57_03580 [Candidatus Poribacteria bacterium]|nr:hypothetical protein [Candidatus Poribacteria bacterium]